MRRAMMDMVATRKTNLLWFSKLPFIISITLFMTSLMFWNCQDAASPSFSSYHKDYVHEFRPKIVAIFEPRISGALTDRVLRKLPFNHSIRVEAQGFSGGVWILWDDSVVVEVLHIANKFINDRFRLEDELVWSQFTAVYANLKKGIRENLWETLLTLCPNDASPWIIGGDFNSIASKEERRGPIIKHVTTSGAISMTKYTKRFLLAMIMPILQPRDSWMRPALGYVKLNSDGSRQVSNDHATCGGVLRDANRQWIMGYTKYIGVCSAIESEFWGVYVGLLEAWSLGYRKVEVDVDCADVIMHIKRQDKEQPRLSILVHILSMIERTWMVSFQQVSSRANQIADGLTKLANHDSLEVSRFENPPSSIATLFLHDEWEGGPQANGRVS
ncbi:hypothetical protein V6N11_084030 [Hibiscus sabdariffa]|uniref:RNase H type-1 domain-containing protein n=1 Tax=Hibiscus sabdariffa TaxID=183260 RepID=A0ABR2QD85_9ROSI